MRAKPPFTLDRTPIPGYGASFTDLETNRQKLIDQANALTREAALAEALVNLRWAVLHAPAEKAASWALVVQTLRSIPDEDWPVVEDAS
jgi:hypothetical protein